MAYNNLRKQITAIPDSISSVLLSQASDIAEKRENELLEKQKQMLASLATLVALGRVDNDGCVECEDLDNFIKRYS